MAKPNTQLLTPGEVEKVHRESLRILQEVGVKFPHREVLEAFKKQGAQVDYDTSVVKLPGKLVEEAVQRQVQNNKRYYAGQEMQAENHPIRMWMSMGNLKQYIDPVTYKRRKGCLRDMLEAIVVANQLENLEKVSCFGIPAEYEDEEFIHLIRYYLLVLFSRKRWFLTPIESPHVARCMIEIAKAVAENDIQLRNGSLIYYELEPIQNLEYAKHHLEIFLELTKNKMNTLTTHWGWMGYHTPLSYPALLSLANANILAGIAAIILFNPENMYLDYLFPMHMINRKHTWPLFGSPHQVIFSFLARQLADFYGFQFTLSNCFFSDSIEGNFQLGFERGVTAALSIFGGIDRVGVQGILGADAGISLEQLIIDNEMLKYINFILGHKVRITEEAFAFEEIRKTGPGGNFFNDPKKSEKLKDLSWDSDLFVAEPYENWKKQQAISQVKEKLKTILHEHFPPSPVIDAAKITKVDQILESYIKDKKMLSRFRKSMAGLLKG